MLVLPRGRLPTSGCLYRIWSARSPSRSSQRVALARTSLPLRTWPQRTPANAAVLFATSELTPLAFVSIAVGVSCVKQRRCKVVEFSQQIENQTIGVTRWGRFQQTMATTYAIHIKPRSTAGFVQTSDPLGDGLHIPVTGFVDVGATSESDIEGALELIYQNILTASNGVLWRPTTDGGSKAISAPQKGKTNDTQLSWFLNLCCLQGTLGQIAAQIFNSGSGPLSAFQSSLFPRLQKTPYGIDTDNLGAWQMELRPETGTFTRLEVEARKLAIRLELDTWYIALMKLTPPATLPESIWPSDPDLDAGTGLVYSPFLSLLPPSIYPPGGEQCDQENRRQIGPFPPGPCAPPNSGCCNGCYFPIRNYPSCCFSRTNYPLAR